jgi:uncharacterized protein (DUF4213/DUF364 family)
VTDPVAEVVARLRDRIAPAAAVERVTVGDRVVLVEVTDGDGSGRRTAGVAHRPAGEHSHVDDHSLDRLVAAAGSPVDDAPSVRLDRALGIAAVNALSAPYVDWQAGDPMAGLDSDVDRITTVGLFVPAFRKFEDVAVRVIERGPVDSVPSPDGVRTETFTPADTETAMAGADVVFVTGSAFIYGGVDRYLDAAPAAATVVVIGATASFLPGPLFDRGVDVVAGASVTDVAAVRDAVARGACGTDLHDAGLRKVYSAATAPTGLGLSRRDPSNPPNQ